MHCKYRLLWLVILAVVAAPVAALEKTLLLESAPAHARIYLLRGTQRVPVGVTPLRYVAEFHSEMSVLRFAFELPGYDAKIVEVAATAAGANVKLSGRALVADPAVHKQEDLRALQQRINPELNKTLPALLRQHAQLGLDLTDVARVRRLGADGIYLEMPISLAQLSERTVKTGEQAGTLPQQIWETVGSKMLGALESGALGDSGLAGIVLRVETSGIERKFNVTSRVESSTEMVCVGSYKLVWDGCASYRNGNCVAGNRTVLDPCASRVPKTVSKVVVDPSMTTAKAEARIYLVQPLQSITKEPGMLQLDAAGKVLFKRGPVPVALLPAAANK